jgi:transposase InsO family protein
VIQKGRQKSAIPDLPSKWRKEVKYLHLLDGVLFFRPVLNPHDDLVDVPVLPTGLRKGALMSMHYDPLMCHPASKSLFALARKRYYWPGMSSDCTRVVHACGHCDRAKATLRTGAGLTKPMLYSQPFQRQSINLVGPLTKTKAGFKWILSCIDAFTNYVTFVPLPNKEAATVVDAVFRKCICVHGAPQIMLSDRGSEFMAGTFKALMSEYGIDHRLTSPYCPTTNGQCERAHRRLNAILKICVNLWNKEWGQCLEQAAFSYNVTPLTDFPYSPYYMLHLFHPRLPADLKCLQSTEPTTAAKFPCIGDYIGDKKELQKAVHQTVMVAKLEETTKRKLKADDHQRELQYNPDDLVTVWRPVSSSGKTKSARSSKLLYKNIGPFKVIEPVVRSSAGTSDELPLTYRLLHVSTGKTGTYSARHMFPFMRGTKHSQVSEELMEEWAPITDDGDLGLILRDITEVSEGMYLWMKSRAGRPGFLSLVTTIDGCSDLIEVQLFNTTSDKRVGQWQQVWFDDHADPKKRQPKAISKSDGWNEYRTPVSNKHSNQYKPWLETAALRLPPSQTSPR